MNIDKGVALLQSHLVREDGKIFVQVDADYDGYSSAATLLNYIYNICPSAIYKFNYRLHTSKIHGILPETIPDGTTLVIAPDASSNEYEIHKQLAEKGIDVLVLDHHQAEKVSEYACVINNQLCDYPNKTLSGVGIVYKFCQRIDELLGLRAAEDLLDMVASGLIGDMMDIRNMETRYLIQEGMRQIRNPFLKSMIDKNAYQLKNELTPIGIAFYIVPYVNAVTRVGTPEEKLVLFESMLEWKAYDLIPSTKRGCKGQQETRVEQAIRTCTNVKNRQTKARDNDIEIIEQIIADEGLLENKLLIIRLRELKVDRSIVGLMANELMSKYKRPVAILSPTIHEGTLAWEGSARGYEKSKMADFRQFIRDSGQAFLAEGHANAFGLGILDQDFDSFISQSNKKLENIEFSPNYKVDFIYSANSPEAASTILTLGDMKHLWGQNIDEPLLALENISVTKDMLTLMSRDKNPTLKITLPNGISCIKFKSSEEEFESLYSENGCVTVNIVGKCEVNRYYSSVTPQLIISDYEIINQQDYYF